MASNASSDHDIDILAFGAGRFIEFNPIQEKARPVLDGVADARCPKDMVTSADGQAGSFVAAVLVVRVRATTFQDHRLLLLRPRYETKATNSLGQAGPRVRNRQEERPAAPI